MIFPFFFQDTEKWSKNSILVEKHTIADLQNPFFWFLISQHVFFLTEFWIKLRGKINKIIQNLIAVHSNRNPLWFYILLQKKTQEIHKNLYFNTFVSNTSISLPIVLAKWSLVEVEDHIKFLFNEMVLNKSLWSLTRWKFDVFILNTRVFFFFSLLLMPNSSNYDRCRYVEKHTYTYILSDFLVLVYIFSDLM